MPGKLKDKVALVTGGSSGMGLAAAELFVDNGAVVYITGRRREPLEAATARVGAQLRGVVADASDLDDIDRLFTTIRSETGRIDVLFASVGAGNLTEPLGEVTPESFEQLFGLNVRGTLFTAQRAAELMTGGGSIILNGSAAAEKAIPGSSVYAASKAALKAFARVWSAELAPREYPGQRTASRSDRNASPGATTSRGPRLPRVAHDHRPARSSPRDRHCRSFPRQLRLQFRHRHRAVRHRRDGPILTSRT